MAISSAFLIVFILNRCPNRNNDQYSVHLAIKELIEEFISDPQLLWRNIHSVGRHHTCSLSETFEKRKISMDIRRYHRHLPLTIFFDSYVSEFSMDMTLFGTGSATVLEVVTSNPEE